MKRFFDFLLGHRIAVWITLVVMVAVFAVGARRVETDFNIESLFPRDNPGLIGYREFIETFDRDDDVVTVILQSKEGVLTPSFLEGYDRIAKAVASLPVLHEVINFLDLSDIGMEVDEEIEIRTVRDRLFPQGKPDALRIASFEGELVPDKPYLGNFLNPKMNSAVIPVRLAPAFNNNQGRMDALRSLRGELQRLIPPGSISVAISGMPVARADGMELIRNDQTRLLPLSILVCLCVLWISMGGLWDVLLVISNTFLTLLFSIGSMGFLGMKFSFLSSVVPVILVITGTSYSIHPLVKLRSEPGTRDQNRIAEVFGEISGAVALCCITTMAGFLSLLNTNVDLIREFALISGFGVAIAFLVSVIFLPVFVLSFFRFPGPTVPGRARRPHVKRFASFLAAKVVRKRPAWVLAILTIFGLVGLWFARTISVRAFIFDDFRPDSSLMKHIRLGEETFRGILPISVVFRAKREEAVLRRHFVGKAASMTEFLRGQSEIGKVDSMTDFLAVLWKTLTSGFPGEAGVLPPDDSSLGMVFRLLMASGKLGPGLNFISKDLSSLQVKARVFDFESARAIRFLDRVRAYASTLEDERTSVKVSGSTVMILEAYRNILGNLELSFLLVVAFTIMVFIFVHRDLTTVTIAFFGNLLPLCGTLGVMGWFDIPFKNSTITIFGIALGLAVDDTLYFLHHYRGLMAKGFSRRYCAIRGLASTGGGMISTSIALFFGFLVLLGSEFEAQFLIGVLLCVNIFASIVFDLLFCPSAMLLLGPEKRVSPIR